MRWYFKAGLVVALVWATGRALGVYGEASRDLDLNFLFAFMLTLGGWASVFYVVDWIGRGLGLIRQPAGTGESGGNAGTWAGSLASKWIGRATGAGRTEPPTMAVPPAAGRATNAVPAASKAAARTKVPATPGAPTTGAARRTSRPAGKSRPRSR